MCSPPILISPALQGQPLTGSLFQGPSWWMGRMWACHGVGLRASVSPEPPPPSYCCAGPGPRSSGECLTLQLTSLWTRAMPTRCARGQVSGWARLHRARFDRPMPTPVAQVQGLCGTFTWNQQDDFLTPAGDVETSVAAFASKFRVAGEGRCPSEDSAPLSPCSTHSQRHVFAEAACAVLHGPTFQVAGLGVLLFAPVRWGQYLLCSPLGLLGGPGSLPWAGLPSTGRWQWGPEGMGESVEEELAQFFPPLPARSAKGWWTGNCSTCAAWQPCVAVLLARTACVLCLLPLLVAVPGRVSRLSGGPRHSAVSLLSQLAPGCSSQPSSRSSPEGSKSFATREGPQEGL